MVCFTPVEISVAVTVAAGTALPPGSVTVPNKLPPSLAASKPAISSLVTNQLQLILWAYNFGATCFTSAARHLDKCNSIMMYDYFGPILRSRLLGVNRNQQASCNFDRTAPISRRMATTRAGSKKG